MSLESSALVTFGDFLLTSAYFFIVLTAAEVRIACSISVVHDFAQ